MKFGRKGKPAQHAPVESDASAEAAEASATPVTGPYDADAFTLEQLEDGTRIDLGSLLIQPQGEMELRLQVDEDSGAVLAAVLVTEEAALELRAFAASRSASLWDEIRPGIAAETARMGGTATPTEGEFGPELTCLVPVQDADGQPATQASRVIGIDGPRWLLRAALMGRPVVEPETAAVWEETIRQVVVRRGNGPMAPGAALPLELPPEARRID